MRKTLALFLFLCSSAAFSQTNKSTDENVIYSINALDVKPEFPGGMEKLKAHINQELIKAGFKKEKTLTISTMFTVEKDGSLTDVKVLRIKDTAMAGAVVKILKNLSKWNPGKQAGKTVRTMYALQVVVGS